MRQATISDYLLARALEMSSERIERFGVAPGHVGYYTPCASGTHKEHVVTVSEGRAVCDCPAWGFCKHVLASVGRSAAIAIRQCRWATEQAELDEIVAFHTPTLRAIPEPLKALVRSEVSAARRRIQSQPERRAA